MKTSDDLEAVLAKIKEDLRLKMKHNGERIKELEQEIANAGCGFWDAFFTLGITCIIGAVKKGKLREVQQKYKIQFDLAEKMNSRFHYFDGVKKLAKKLTDVASKEHDSQL
jgi:hypothetical protein